MSLRWYELPITSEDMLYLNRIPARTTETMQHRIGYGKRHALTYIDNLQLNSYLSDIYGIMYYIRW